MADESVEPMTVGRLLTALENIRPETWVYVSNGVVNSFVHEPHANEPFILLTYERPTDG